MSQNPPLNQVPPTTPLPTASQPSTHPPSIPPPLPRLYHQPPLSTTQSQLASLVRSPREAVRTSIWFPPLRVTLILGPRSSQRPRVPPIGSFAFEVGYKVLFVHWRLALAR